MNFNRLLQTCKVENSLLLLARIAYVYYIWLERKARCFTKNLKSEDDVTRFMMEATHKKILLIAIVQKRIKSYSNEDPPYSHCTEKDKQQKMAAACFC